MSIPSQRRALAMGILIFASFMDLLDVTIVQVALPQVRDQLAADSADLEWIVSGYMLAFAVVLITGGRLGDAFGRQRIFVIGVSGFTLASALASLAWSGDALVAARVAQGAFAGLMVPQVLSTLQALYAPRERAAMIGVIGGVSGISAVIGPVLGGWLVSADVAGLGWRVIFLLNVPVGVLIVVLALRFLPNTRSPARLRLDLGGVALLSLGLLGVLYPIVEGRTLGWPAWLWGVALAGVALLGVFVAVERRRPDPLLPLRLFGNRGFTAGLVTQATFQGAMNAFTVVFIIYVQSVLGFTALGAGLSILPFSLGAFVGTGIAIPLGTRVGKPMVTLGALVQFAGIAWAMAIVGGRGASLTGWDLVWPMAAAGVGLGLLIVPLVDIALSTVRLTDAGAASGVYSTFQQIGAATGVAVSGSVFFTAVGTDWSQVNVEHALGSAVLVSLSAYVLSAVASLFLPKRELVRAHVEELERALELDAA